MSSETIILGIAGFLHNLFTVVWIGGLVMIVITVLPAAKNSLDSNKHVQQLMHAILKQHRKWVYISIIGLLVSGIVQARMAPSFNGVMQFDSSYSSIVSIKHILTIIMIAISLFRSIVFGKKGMNITPQQSKFSLKLVFINASIGVVLLFASAFLALA